MTTTYGTIPTIPTRNHEYATRARERLRMGLGTRRPWPELLALGSLTLPPTFRDAVSRAKTNISYFRVNYAIALLSVLFLTLLWRPVSLLVLVGTMSAWLFLYFLRDDPLTLFGRVVDDRVVLISLSIMTVALVSMTSATVNVLVAGGVGGAFALLHATVRRTEDLFLDEDDDEERAVVVSGDVKGFSSGNGRGEDDRAPLLSSKA